MGSPGLRTLTYRCPAALEQHPIAGELLMGDGPRTRTAYRVVGIRRVNSQSPGLGTWTWRLTCEAMPIAAGKAEAAQGVPCWGLAWDKRTRRSP